MELQYKKNTHFLLIAPKRFQDYVRCKEFNTFANKEIIDSERFDNFIKTGTKIYPNYFQILNVGISDIIKHCILYFDLNYELCKTAFHLH